jgi:hypothetical protein
VVGAAEWRIRDTARAADAAENPAVDENRAARILEYFGKS